MRHGPAKDFGPLDLMGEIKAVDCVLIRKGNQLATGYSSTSLCLSPLTSLCLSRLLQTPNRANTFFFFFYGIWVLNRKYCINFPFGSFWFGCIIFFFFFFMIFDIMRIQGKLSFILLCFVIIIKKLLCFCRFWMRLFLAPNQFRFYYWKFFLV